jgi:hypothetical protein
MGFIVVSGLCLVNEEVSDAVSSRPCCRGRRCSVACRGRAGGHAGDYRTGATQPRRGVHAGRAGQSWRAPLLDPVRQLRQVHGAVPLPSQSMQPERYPTPPPPWSLGAGHGAPRLPRREQSSIALVDKPPAVDAKPCSAGSSYAVLSDGPHECRRAGQLCSHSRVAVRLPPPRLPLPAPRGLTNYRLGAALGPALETAACLQRRSS